MPFDEKSHTVPNQYGCILNEKREEQIGLYVAGWAKRGPVGIIDATLRDSMDTFKTIKFHIEEGLIKEKDTSVEEVEKVIEGKIVSFKDWEVIDKVEVENGKKKGKVREKITSKDEMMKLIS
jgi:NADPH-dependent glutamate synthase beta subunit-like oxidoreductase